MNNKHLAESPELSRRRYNLASLRRIVAAWHKRRRLRKELERMSKANPHMIDDIGLTNRQVEAELAKHFWQV